jgi:hypothetical protein
VEIFTTYFQHVTQLPTVTASRKTYLGLLIQGNVRHLLTGVEQAVLGALAENVLQRSDINGSKQWRHPNRCQPGGDRATKEQEAKEGHARDEEDNGRDLSGNAPAKLAEDDAGEEHHAKGDETRAGGEVAHEGGVVVGVGELEGERKESGQG